MIKPFQSGLVPLGQFDFDDSELSLLRGGEVVVFDKKTVSVVEKVGTDVYVDSERTGFRIANEQDAGPFFLADPSANGGGLSGVATEQTSLFSSGYGVISYEQVSGKATIWGTEGFYTISTDSVDASITESTSPNAALYVSTDGRLTATTSTSKRIAAYFVEYRKKSIAGQKLYNLPGTDLKTDVVVVYKTAYDGYSNTLGAVVHKTASTSADLTLDDTHYTIRVDASSAIRTITLPTAASCTGRIYVIKKIDSSSNAVMIQPAGAEIIDGASSSNISTQYMTRTIQSNGISWDII